MKFSTYALLLCLVCTTLLASAATAQIQAADDSDPHNAITFQDTLGFLMEFRQAFGPDFRKKYWKGSEYCKWVGVTCLTLSHAPVDTSASIDYANVEVHVNLRGLKLVGATPAVPDRIDAGSVGVVAIDLSGNPGIYGGFSRSWAQLPRLRSINLSDTSVSGALPYSWSNLRSLETISITNAKVCGGLPDWTAERLPNLATVDLRNNNFHGTLSDVFATLAIAGKLTKLDIQGNGFCGCLSSAWDGNALLRASAQTVSITTSAPACTVSDACKAVVKCVAVEVPTDRPINPAQKNWWVFMFLFVFSFLALVGCISWYLTKDNEDEEKAMVEDD